MESTGIKGADEFISRAHELGLTTKINVITNDPVYYQDGETVMLPGSTSVSVQVRIPVPKSLGNTALTMIDRNTVLISCWARRHDGRARGRWTMGNYSTLGGHDDMHTFKRCGFYLELMASNAASLVKYAAEKESITPAN